MKSTIRLSISYHPIPLFVSFARSTLIGFLFGGEVVFIDKIIPGVVGRVDVDHFHLPEVGFLEELEGVEVVAFDVEVFCVLEIHRLLAAGAQRQGDGRVRQRERLALAGPIEAVAFLRAFDEIGGEFLFQQIELVVL